MPKHVEGYLDLLRNAGYRITAQRQQICHYLATTTKHPTPYEVYEAISAQHPEISRATVYNTLNTLQSLGAIVEISFGANHTHYDTDPTPHVNLICLRCHAVEDYHPLTQLIGTAIPEPQRLLGPFAQDNIFQQTIEQLGFQPIAAKIDLIGLCRCCQQATQSES